MLSGILVTGRIWDMYHVNVVKESIIITTYIRCCLIYKLNRESNNRCMDSLELDLLHPDPFSKLKIISKTILLWCKSLRFF